MSEHHEGEHSGNPDHEVEVVVDKHIVKAKPGIYTAAQLKDEFKIDPAKVLAVRIDAGFTLLADDAEVHIKDGGEVFMSHRRRGGSSCH